MLAVSYRAEMLEKEMKVEADKVCDLMPFYLCLVARSHPTLGSPPEWLSICGVWFSDAHLEERWQLCCLM